MKNFNKKVLLSGVGIAFLLATTSVHAMEKEKDKPKTPAPKPAVVVQPNPQNAAAAAAPAPSAAPVAPVAPVPDHIVKLRPLVQKRFDMRYIPLNLQPGAKLIHGNNSWTVTTTSTSNRDERTPHRRQLEAYLEIGQGAVESEHTTIRITGEIEWVSGLGSVYFGLIDTENTLLKWTSQDNRAVVGLAPDTPREDFVPQTEINQGRPIYKINWEIAPGAHDVAFFIANLEDKPAQYTIRNIQVVGPVDITGILNTSQAKRLAFTEATQEGTLVDDNNKRRAAAFLQREKQILKHIESTNPSILGHRIHKGSHNEKSGTDGKEKAYKEKGKEKEKQAASPPSAAMKAKLEKFGGSGNGSGSPAAAAAAPPPAAAKKPAAAAAPPPKKPTAITNHPAAIAKPAAARPPAATPNPAAATEE